jgi:phosphatidylinositol 4-kinase
MSNMYSLLNYIAAASKEMYDALKNSAPNDLFSSSKPEHTMMHSDSATLHSIETSSHGNTEEEKRLITISTISVVSRLALEFKRDDVSLNIRSASCSAQTSYTGNKANNCNVNTTASHF